MEHCINWLLLSTEPRAFIAFVVIAQVDLLKSIKTAVGELLQKVFSLGCGRASAAYCQLCQCLAVVANLRSCFQPQSPGLRQAVLMQVFDRQLPASDGFDRELLQRLLLENISVSVAVDSQTL